MTRRHRSDGFSLIEVIFAIALSAAVAVIGIQHLRTPGVTAKDRSCDLRREVLQNDARRYFDATGRWPSSDLTETANPQYSGDPLPACPTSGTAYRLDRGRVVCPAHP